MLHIGDDVMLFISDILAIVDRASMESAHSGREKLHNARKLGTLAGNEKICASYVIAMKNGREFIYCSPISSQTLYKRTNVPLG